MPNKFDADQILKLFRQVDKRIDKLECFFETCCEKVPVNIGNGEGLYKRFSHNKWEFKSLIAGNNITITDNGNDLTITGSVTPITCSDIDTCLGISALGDPNKYLNEQGNWQTISSIPALTNTQIAFGDVTNLMTSSSNLTFDGNILQVDTTGSASGWGQVSSVISSSSTEAGLSLINTSVGGHVFNIISTGAGSGVGAGNFSIGDATTSQNIFQYTSSTNDYTLPFLGGGGNLFVTTDNNGVLGTSTIPSPSLTATYVGYGSVGNTLTGNSKFIYDEANLLFSVGFNPSYNSLLVDDTNLIYRLGDASLNHLTLDSTTYLFEVLLQGNSFLQATGGNFFIGYNALTSNNTNILLDDASPANHKIYLNSDDGVVVSNLSGGATEMVVADATGLLSKTPYTSGTVTSVDMSVPTGLTISGNPITTSGTLALSLTAGYVIPTTTEETNWNTAYTNRITSLTTVGTSGAATLIANTLNIPQYTDTYTGTVTSVGLSMPSAFTVTGSPVTTSGTLAVTGAGTTAQYIRGDGTLATLPSATTRLDQILAATATNTIANANYAQVWNWDTLTTEIPLTIGSTSITTGSLLKLISSSTVGNASKMLEIVRSGANSTSGKTNYGVYSSINNTGTNAVNYGLYGSMQGTNGSATAYLYSTNGALGAAGNTYSLITGGVGNVLISQDYRYGYNQGTPLLTISPAEPNPTGLNTDANTVLVNGTTKIFGSSRAYQRDFYIRQSNSYASGSNYNITDAATLAIEGGFKNSGGVNDRFTNSSALLIQSSAVSNGSGIVTNSYGIYVNAQTGGANNYAGVLLGGNVGIGLSAPTAVLHLKAGTATANTAPLKFTSGTLNTVSVAGQVEYDGVHHVTQSGAVSYHIGGSLTSNVTQTGNTAGVETTLFTYTVPASTLINNTDSLQFSCSGTFANTANTDKRIKVVYGATTVYDSGTLAITTSNSWSLEGEIFRSGATTQKCVVRIQTSSATLVASCNYTTAAEILSGTVILKVTGNGTSASDVVGEVFDVRYFPRNA